MSEPLSTAAPPATPAPQDPVTAAVVPAPHSPWQFGLKAFLGLIAVCCVQFALMKYLTVLGGLGLPTVVVQEGGYNLGTLGELVLEALTGIEEGIDG